MTLGEELVALAQQGVQLWVEDGQLRIRAPKGVLTPESREVLAAHRDEIVATLRHAPSLHGSGVQAEQGIVSGPSPLTPPQYQFLKRLHRGQKKLAYAALNILQTVDPAVIETALQHVVVHHDALRLRFPAEPGAAWAYNATVEEHPLFSRSGLSSASAAQQETAIEQATAELVGHLDSTEGPLLQAAYFDLGRDRPARLVMLFDHLAVDLYSVSVIMQDLESCCRQLMRGETPQLPAKTTSFKYWAERLKSYAESDELRHELEYWLAETHKSVDLLPADYPKEPGATGFQREVVTSFSTEHTASILALTRTSGVQIDRILLAALAAALHESSGLKTVRISLRNHGRQPPFDDVDVSRTVGLFINAFPVTIEGGLEGRPKDALERVRERLSTVPRDGIGYELLTRASRSDTGLEPLRARNQITLNYQGQVDGLRGERRLFASRSQMEEQTAVYPVPANGRWRIASRVEHGRLWLRVNYHERVYRRETIQGVVAGIGGYLQSLTADCELG